MQPTGNLSCALHERPYSLLSTQTDPASSILRQFDWGANPKTCA